MWSKSSNASQHLTKVKHFLFVFSLASLPVSPSCREICSQNVKSRVIAWERKILINCLWWRSPTTSLLLPLLYESFISLSSPCLRGHGSACKANQRTDGHNKCKGQKINSSAMNDRASLGDGARQKTDPCRTEVKAQARLKK